MKSPRLDLAQDELILIGTAIEAAAELVKAGDRVPELPLVGLARRATELRAAIPEQDWVYLFEDVARELVDGFKQDCCRWGNPPPGAWSVREYDPGSSSGRMPGFGPGERGSTPRPGA